MSGFLACWHRWRSSRLRILARRVGSLASALIVLSDRLALAAHRALVESLAAGARGGPEP